MKVSTALVLTLTAALLQLGCAYPQASVQQVQHEGNLFNEIFQGFGDLAKDFVEGFQNASQSGAETAQHFIENLANSTQQFIKEAEQYADSIGDSVRTFQTEVVTKFTATLQAFHANLNAQIQVLENQIKRGVLIDIERQLKLVNSKVLPLEQNALTVRDHISEAIIEQEQSILRGWNVWSAEQLEKVSVLTDGDDEAINQAREVIDEFNNRYDNFLSSCADEQEFELQDFESRLLETIARYQNVLQQIITQVELCLNGDDSSSASLQCRRNVENVLHGFVKAPADFAKLIKESAKLLSTDYSRRYCVVNTLVEFKVKSYSVQRQLNTIIVETNERKAESDDVSESDNKVNNDIEVGSQSDSKSDSNSESDSSSIESDNQSDNLIDSQSESDNNSEDDSSSESDNQSDNLIDRSSDSQSDSQSDSNSESDNNGEDDSSSESDNQSDNLIDRSNDIQSDSQSDSDSDSESANDSESASDSDSNSGSDSQSDIQTDNLSDSQRDSQSNAESSNDNESDNEVSGSGNDSQSDSNNSDSVSDDSNSLDAVDSN